MNLLIPPNFQNNTCLFFDHPFQTPFLFLQVGSRQNNSEFDIYF